jgi:CMP-2-keto-3-deoxyoctulosonic acid synthetase
MPFKAVGIIPARWGSTRFPGKALHPIAGKPLLRHVWERCARAKSLASVIIATDDMRIAEAAFDWGAEVAMTSPKHPSGTDRPGGSSAPRARVLAHHQYPGRRAVDRSEADRSSRT